MTSSGLLVQFLCILLQGVLRGGADENEYRLTRFLLRDYDASVRPVENSSLPLTVTFGISLHHIIDVEYGLAKKNCWSFGGWSASLFQTLINIECWQQSLSTGNVPSNASSTGRSLEQ